ncbi:MAG: exodeoxyribonuclease VII large subunit [Christensenellales bacterium]
MQFNNLSVVEFNNIVKNIFDSEEMLFNCAVVGEVSSFKITGGIAYFTIKDDFACLNCVWFGPEKDLKIGEKVKVVGRPNFYVKGGKLNFNVNFVTSFGEGDIYKRFLALKQKLADEGYFVNKKELPKVVSSIGVVSSSKGAVIKDIISVTKRRNPNVNIYIFPAKVQGEGADKEICRGIEFFDNFDVDVVIVARGGGSSEDLNVFNCESVAKACFCSKKPIISAVGHETDYTLIDMVADVRASTPSVAAEIAVKESKNYETLLKIDCARLVQAINFKFESAKQKLQTKQQSGKTVLLKVEKLQNALQDFVRKIERETDEKVDFCASQLKDLLFRCEMSNPKLFMQKGYALVEKNNFKVENVDQVMVGDRVKVFLNGGVFVAKIEGVEKNDD